ncbi:MAG TPA: ester cyclase [Acidimicrobiia bacterium]|nr:ester cyclase [Acidimicrobiia bacterium]HKN89825.1 ester cyclase [Acidimicrobiia bacterium]
MADNLQLIEQHMKAWSSGDIDGILACFTEDCVFEDMALPARFEGQDALREFAVAVFAALPDFHWSPTTMFGDGARVCTESHFTGTQTGDFPGIPATGKAADIPCLSVDEIRDGRIQRHADYWSLATYLQQVGLMPTPEP